MSDTESRLQQDRDELYARTRSRFFHERQELISQLRSGAITVDVFLENEAGLIDSFADSVYALGSAQPVLPSLELVAVMALENRRPRS